MVVVDGAVPGPAFVAGAATVPVVLLSSFCRKKASGAGGSEARRFVVMLRGHPAPVAVLRVEPAVAALVEFGEGEGPDVNVDAPDVVDVALGF